MAMIIAGFRSGGATSTDWRAKLRGLGPANERLDPRCHYKGLKTSTSRLNPVYTGGLTIWLMG